MTELEKRLQGRDVWSQVFQVLERAETRLRRPNICEARVFAAKDLGEFQLPVKEALERGDLVYSPGHVASR